MNYTSDDVTPEWVISVRLYGAACKAGSAFGIALGPWGAMAGCAGAMGALYTAEYSLLATAGSLIQSFRQDLSLNARTPAEAQEFLTAFDRIGNATGTVASILAFSGLTKGLMNITHTPTTKPLSHDIKALDLGISNKGFYNPRIMEQYLKSQYGDAVSSSTLPLLNHKNVKLAGTRHPVSGIVFDQRGFPIFDDIAKFDTKISREVAMVFNERNHMRAATQNLAKSINSGQISPNVFTPTQLREILAGRDRITGYTWHHHQELGRMQLIPRDIHMQTGHVGGMELWIFKN